jgi:hypothetical protein
VQPKFYAQIRDFFQAVRTGDEEQIVVAPDSTTVTVRFKTDNRTQW